MRLVWCTATGLLGTGLFITALGTVTTCAESDPCGAGPLPSPSPEHQVLLDLAGEAFQTTPPDTFRVLLETTKGDVTVDVLSEWAPLGAQRFYNLVRNRFFDGTRFFRVLTGGIVQFGVHGVPEVQAAWNDFVMPDDSVSASNLTGTLVFATAGPNTRTTQLFINYRDNVQYDSQGFAPIGRVTDGMHILLQLNGEYGDMASLGGNGVNYQCLIAGGEAYLARYFDRMDRIISARIINGSAAGGPS